MASRSKVTFVKVGEREYVIECNDCGLSTTDSPDYWGYTTAEWKEIVRESHVCQ